MYAGSARVAEMTIGATRFGSSSLNSTCRVGTPSTFAAEMNSRSRSESTWPRMSRARLAQPKNVSTQIRR